MRSVVSVHVVYYNRNTETKVEQNVTVLSGTRTKQKTITHNSKWENRLPKYGSQSETTIASCL